MCKVIEPRGEGVRWYSTEKLIKKNQWKLLTEFFSDSPSSMLISFGSAVKDCSAGGVPLMEPARGGGDVGGALDINPLSTSISILK